MKKVSFDFLATMPLKEIDKSPSSVVGGKSPVAGADFRLFSDGSIYPSVERIKADQLEFQTKDSGLPEFGYDVFLSTDWSQYQGNVKFPCIAKVSKHESKVDLFGSTKFDANGIPKSSIMTLKTTHGEDLIKYLEASYCEPGEHLFAHKTYVDLKIKFAYPMETTSKIYNFPKKIIKGKDAGKTTYIRRENIVVFPLEIMEVSTVTPPVLTPMPEPEHNKTNAHNPVPQDVAEKIFN